MTNVAPLSQEELRKLLSYDAETGIFRWKQRRRGGPRGTSIAPGSIAGQTIKGYLVIGVKSKRYRAHRLAWFYIFGQWPENLIDHINGNPFDNRISNLRQATCAQNSSHQTKLNAKNTTGFRGVSFHKRKNKFQAVVRANNKIFHLGYFASAAVANEVAKDFRKQAYGEFSGDLSA